MIPGNTMQTQEEPDQVDTLSTEIIKPGWTPLFAEKYPRVVGAGHYATYLENTVGFEVELIASG